MHIITRPSPLCKLLTPSNQLLPVSSFQPVLAPAVMTTGYLLILIYLTHQRPVIRFEKNIKFSQLDTTSKTGVL
jgi:hypothetical protein